MDVSQFSTTLRREVNQYVCNGRGESAAFLAWYLKNLFRLDEQDAIDSVCDSTNDKGIDAIYVDDEEEELYIFQSKFSPDDFRDQGDNDIRNFVGARQWFRDESTITQLLSSTASEELKALVNGLKIKEKMGLGYKVFLEFVTNKVFDTNAKEFLDINQQELSGSDINALFKRYTYIADEEITFPTTNLQLINRTKIDYNLPSGIVVRVYPIPAKELLKLDGIQNRLLFYKNVRYGLGKTRVNKDIKRTILDAGEHNNFFLYHNGLTIVCGTLEDTTDGIRIGDYAVINGCQSMLTFYENRDKLTDNVFVLTKIIKLDPSSPLIQQITYYTNNQNSISLKDLKSNDRVQKHLCREFNEVFNNSVLYKIKTGAAETGYGEIIEIDFAAQLIAAFFLKEPQNTHLKARLFGELYTDIFSRKVNAKKIYLAYTVYQVISNNVDDLTNDKIKNYGLAMFFFTYVVNDILSSDSLGSRIINDPTVYVTTKLDQFKTALLKLWKLLIPEINAYIDEYTTANNNFFDYKNVFKSSEFVQTAARKIKADHQRILIRHPEDAFEAIFNSLSSSNAISPTVSSP